MEKAASKPAPRGDTFLVRTVPTTPASDVKSPVSTLTLPDGRVVHALDRSVFDEAVKQAFTK